MKKLLILIIGIFAAGQVLAQDMSAEEIVSKYLEVIGQDKIMDVQTLKVTGTMSIQGIDLQLTVYMKQPDKSRMEIEFQGIKTTIVFDSEKGWTIDPSTGSMDPMDLPPETIKRLDNENRQDPSVSWKNPFLNWKENGIKVELEGIEDVEGATAYKLKITFKDNYVVHYFVDTDSFLLLKTITRESNQGQVYDSEIRFSDYNDIDGILFPEKTTIMMNGQIAQLITIDKSELNAPVDDSIFEKPVPGEE